MNGSLNGFAFFPFFKSSQCTVQTKIVIHLGILIVLLCEKALSSRCSFSSISCKCAKSKQAKEALKIKIFTKKQGGFFIKFLKTRRLENLDLFFFVSLLWQ